MTNYSTTQIYKFVCKDPTITSFYIGSTTNFTKRKYSHKKCCNNENSKGYNYLIYQTMRKYGGFENWNMILIEDYTCENKREAEKREQYWKDLLKPDLNVHNPFSYEFSIKLNPKEFNKELYQKELLKNSNFNKERYQKSLLKNPNLGKERHQKKLLKNQNFCKEHYQKYKYNYKVKCDCGSNISYFSIYCHKRSKKHILYEENLNKSITK
jgi:hypothetical protein